jgi:pre-mRNA-processing factor SLU7
MTHKRKDCLERPRKKGAKYTNQDIAADEVVQDIEAGYDAKRDRWNGYDPSEHSKIYEEYAAIEAARQKLREEQIDSQTDAAVRKVAKAGGGGNDEFGSSDEEDADEDKYADAADAVGQKLDAKTRITVRNLRIREDTAKYLINLDPSSAYYDPKTRSMRDNPSKNVNPEDVSNLSAPRACVAYTSMLTLFIRHNSLVIISCVTRVKLWTFKSSNCLLGNPLLAATTFI